LEIKVLLDKTEGIGVPVMPKDLPAKLAIEVNKKRIRYHRPPKKGFERDLPCFKRIFGLVSSYSKFTSAFLGFLGFFKR